MRSSPRRIPTIGMGLLAACAVLLDVGEALAKQEIETTSDRVIFGKDQALWSMPASGGERTLLMNLLWPAEDVTSLRAAADGSAILLRANGFTAWAELTESPVLRLLPCSGPAEISADGDAVVCGTQDGLRIAIYTLRPTLGVRIIDSPAPERLFFGTDPESIVGARDTEVRDLSNDELLASHRPDHSLVVTPDGKRALGAYTEGGIDIVHGFRLDGQAVKRTLMHAARSVATSADSSWAAIQQDNDACAVRIVGGQYMCWRRARALDISSAGHSLLVTRTNDSGSHDLLLGAVRGTSSVKPTLLVEQVAAAAVFWPASGTGE